MKTNLHEQSAPRWPRPGSWVRLALALLVSISAARGAGDAGPASSAPAQLRLAFSSGAIGDINHNDAKAAIIAWGRGVLEPRGLRVTVQPSIYDRAEDLFRALQQGKIDATAVLTDEYLRRPAGVEPDFVFLSLKRQKVTEHYVLLVRADRGIGELEGLTGKNIELHRSARTSLAPYWIDVCLADRGLGLAETVFRRIERPEKASRAVQRLFFRQIDACIVTQEAFETLGELNPQLRRDLRVLATSPEVVPSVFFFRPDYRDGLRREMEAAIATLHETVAGRQALTVFQGDRLQKHPLTCLKSTLELLAAAVRVRSAAPDPAAGGAPLKAPR